MNILSEKLALVLADYTELPLSIQKSIDYYGKNKLMNRLKGDLRLHSINKKYLCVNQSLFANSLLTSIYGTMIYRTNEDSFDTLLHDYFECFFYVARIKENEELITKYIKGMETYALDNSVENLWHILNLAKKCIEDSHQSNFSSLLIFYSLAELLILRDIKKRKEGNFLHQECGRKLPHFYQKINLLNCPAIYRINSSLSESKPKFFEKLTLLRHKVIHGVFNEARDVLEELFPIQSCNGEYIGMTEDAESSAFQDQVQNLNMILRCVLCEILKEWMESPTMVANLKSKDF